MRWGPPLRRRRDGTIEVRLDDAERDLLRSLPGQLRELLASEGDDPSLRRLAPPAYASDVEHEAEYRRLMGDELQERRVASLEVLERSAGATQLDEDEAQAWLRSLNALRLVLGTRLDVSEGDHQVDDDDPSAPAFALYGWLTWLQAAMVDALRGGL